MATPQTPEPIEPVAFRLLGGTEPDCLLVHGFAADRMSWLANLPALLPKFRVHAIDLPGHGESSLEVGDGTPETLSRQVEVVLTKKGLGPQHVIAHSLGGAIALLLAERRPDLVASLILISPLGLGQGVDEGFLRTLTDIGDADEALVLLRRMVNRPQVIGPQVAARLLSQLERPGARQALKQIAAGITGATPAVRRAAGAIAKTALPRLSVWGGRDAINALSPEALAGFGGRQHVLEQAGHLPHIEEPRPFNALISSFHIA